MADLREMAREWADARISEYASILDYRLDREQVIDLLAAFAEKVLRRAAEITEQEPIMRNDASEGGNVIAEAIRREFGL